MSWELDQCYYHSAACARSDFRAGLYPLAAVRRIVAERLAGPAVVLFDEFAGGGGRSGTGSRRRARLSFSEACVTSSRNSSGAETPPAAAETAYGMSLRHLNSARLFGRCQSTMLAPIMPTNCIR